MKILHLCKFDVPERGGVEKVAHELCVGLSAIDGVTSDMLAMSETMQPTAQPYRIFRSKINVKFGVAPLSLGYVLDYLKLIKSYDIVHLHHPNPLPTLLVCLFLCGKKLVVHWHSDIVKQKYSYVLFRHLERWMLKRASKIIVTSPPYALSSKALQAFQHRIVTIPIGIEDGRQEAIEEQDVVDISTQYRGRRVIFSLGRLIYYKGYEYLIDAAKSISDDAIILIGGTGILRPSLEAQIKAHGLSHKVKLLGYITRSQCLAYYKQCDIFCMSSIARSEAFGIVQLEAMCFSKPVISTRIQGSGVDWVNLHGKSGITVEPKSGEAIAVAINQLLSDTKLFNELSTGARHRFESLFERSIMVNDTLKMYKNLMI
jgi:glycosyltransferase involved in cell wall biosynthesis